jgi:3-isopropylmalate/(R)-2-methylmalate dehydratase small subunit
MENERLKHAYENESSRMSDNYLRDNQLLIKDFTDLLKQEYLKRITRHGFEDALFKAWREDPSFVLNKPEYKNATILVAGPEFGTGSSREHAVWALMDYGFKAVLSSRYADIFRGNSGKAGLVTAEVPQDVIEKIWAMIEKDPNTQITVDLDKRQVKAGDLLADFQIDDYVRWRLMEGLDDIGLTLRHESKITEFEKSRPSYKPVTL